MKLKINDFHGFSGKKFDIEKNNIIAHREEIARNIARLKADVESAQLKMDGLSTAGEAVSIRAEIAQLDAKINAHQVADPRSFIVASERAVNELHKAESINERAGRSGELMATRDRLLLEISKLRKEISEQEKNLLSDTVDMRARAAHRADLVALAESGVCPLLGMECEASNMAATFLAAIDDGSIQRDTNARAAVRDKELLIDRFTHDIERAVDELASLPVPIPSEEIDRLTSAYIEACKARDGAYDAMEARERDVDRRALLQKQIARAEAGMAELTRARSVMKKTIKYNTHRAICPICGEEATTDSVHVREANGDESGWVENIHGCKHISRAECHGGGSVTVTFKEFHDVEAIEYKKEEE